MQLKNRLGIEGDQKFDLPERRICSVILEEGFAMIEKMSFVQEK